MMAELYVLMAERKDNSDGKTMFGLFLLVRTSLLNQWSYDREPVYEMLSKSPRRARLDTYSFGI